MALPEKYQKFQQTLASPITTVPPAINLLSDMIKQYGSHSSVGVLNREHNVIMNSIFHVNPTNCPSRQA